MEQRICNMARILVANGYGFGKYWSGYIFGKTAKDPHFVYLSDNKMAILSAGIDEDGEKSILDAADELSHKQLYPYFNIDYSKRTHIEWIGRKINFILLCEKEETVKNNTAYFMWPAIKLDFSPDIKENTIVVYDRRVSPERIEKLKSEAEYKGIIDKVEFWTMVKHLMLTDRFGEFAPKICMEAVTMPTKKK